MFDDSDRPRRRTKRPRADADASLIERPERREGAPLDEHTYRGRPLGGRVTRSRVIADLRSLGVPHADAYVSAHWEAMNRRIDTVRNMGYNLNSRTEAGKLAQRLKIARAYGPFGEGNPMQFRRTGDMYRAAAAEASLAPAADPGQRVRFNLGDLANAEDRPPPSDDEEEPDHYVYGADDVPAGLDAHVDEHVLQPRLAEDGAAHPYDGRPMGNAAMDAFLRRMNAAVRADADHARGVEAARPQERLRVQQLERQAAGLPMGRLPKVLGDRIPRFDLDAVESELAKDGDADGEFVEDTTLYSLFRRRDEFEDKTATKRVSHAYVLGITGASYRPRFVSQPPTVNYLTGYGGRFWGGCHEVFASCPDVYSTLHKRERVNLPREGTRNGMTYLVQAHKFARGFTFVSTTRTSPAAQMDGQVSGSASVFVAVDSASSGNSSPGYITYVPRVGAEYVAPRAPFDFRDMNIFNRFVRRAERVAPKRPFRTGEVVTGKYIDVHGVLTCARFIRTKSDTSFTDDNLRGNVHVASAGIPGSTNSEEIRTNYLPTVHRVMVLAVRANAVNEYTMTSVLRPASQFTHGALVQESDYTIDFLHDARGFDIFAPYDVEFRDDVRVLSDKLYTTNAQDPILHVRQNVQLDGAEFRFRPQAATSAYVPERNCVGQHIIVLYASYIPELPPDFADMVRPQAETENAVTPLCPHPSGVYINPDFSDWNLALGTYSATVPYIVPGRFRFTTTFTYTDK